MRLKSHLFTTINVYGFLSRKKALVGIIHEKFNYFQTKDQLKYMKNLIIQNLLNKNC